MQIHVVRPGDSIWGISQQYGVSQAIIIEANKLNQIPHLVVGQALVIPGIRKTYVIKGGDNIWSISRKFNVSANYLQIFNGISNPNSLQSGSTIIIPAQSKKYGFIETNGFIEASTTSRENEIINEVGSLLTFISTFSYQVSSTGQLIPMKDTNILETSKRYRIQPLMTITNFVNGTFDTDLGHTILNNNTVQQTLINSILSTLKSKGYYGLIVDFERISPDDKEAYNEFLRKVTRELHAQNYIIATALAPKTSGAQTGAWYSAHDYPAHGRIVDFVILMTYEWGWSGGPPLPVAPINQVRAVINYAVSVIPPKKIMMGMPLYGYDWPLPYQPHGGFAPRVSPQQAIIRAANNGAIIQYDYQAQSPFIRYYNKNGVEHIIWFEDARSSQAKFVLASNYGLRGVSYWELGSDFPQNWEVLNDMFRIEKL